MRLNQNDLWYTNKHGLTFQPKGRVLHILAANYKPKNVWYNNFT